MNYGNTDETTRTALAQCFVEDDFPQGKIIFQDETGNVYFAPATAKDFCLHAAEDAAALIPAEMMESAQMKSVLELLTLQKKYEDTDICVVQIFQDVAVITHKEQSKQFVTITKETLEKLTAAAIAMMGDGARLHGSLARPLVGYLNANHDFIVY